MPNATLNSFWLAGFECSDLLNCYGDRIDLLALTGHIDQVYQDYALLKSFNIKTVREGIRWSKVEVRPYCYDFSIVKRMMDAADHFKIQQIWDICHFGYPDDLSPLHPHFTKRFVSVCSAFISFYRKHKPLAPLMITPINEVGFISWLGGENGSTTPYARHMGWDIKYALMRAYIKGIEELRRIDPSVEILITEPIVNIVPPLNPSVDEIEEAKRQHEIQFQVIDMLTGLICPELGGKPEYLDMIGFNYYYNNQWISGSAEFLPWANLEPDDRWCGLSALLIAAYKRYGYPILLSETSHAGIDRPNWIKFITKECATAINAGVNFRGICIYPIIDRPDWDNLSDWHHSGLWDANPVVPRSRNLYIPFARALLECQEIIKKL